MYELIHIGALTRLAGIRLSTVRMETVELSADIAQIQPGVGNGRSVLAGENRWIALIWKMESEASETNLDVNRRCWLLI